MIDVWSVGANGLWVLGLAILLAALSWAAWAAAAGGEAFRIVIMRPPIRLGIDAGLLLFCAGLAATARTWWERVLWGALAAAWGAQVWISRQKKMTAGREESA
ncbi:MAG: hypothetical protein PVI59_14640 [Anaerolineae bacterium]|jgi:hypothetical protein